MKESKNHECPTCGRKFHTFLDYPIVKVRNVEFIDPDQVPDKVITRGDAFHHVNEKDIPDVHVEKTLKLKSGDDYEFEGDDGFVYSIVWIHGRDEFRWEKHRNHSKMLKDVLVSENMTRYKERLMNVVGKEVDPDILRPDFIIDDYHDMAMVKLDFKERIFVYINIGGDEPGKMNVRLYKDGANLGAAGGPSLAYLMTVGSIKADGIL